MPNDTHASAQIDAILAALPADQRAALRSLRRTIAAAAPEAVEAISYALPAFKYRGRPLVSYGAAKTHVAFYCMSPAAMERHKDLLAGYDTTKGSIRFQPDDPLPDSLITTLVKARMAETDAAVKKP
jgi:uncharacterized protein YdhG (YjbR/CyaY superfamily)